MIYGLENILTLTLFIIGFIIVLYAQIKINSTYGKYKNIKLNKVTNTPIHFLMGWFYYTKNQPN